MTTDDVLKIGGDGNQLFGVTPLHFVGVVADAANPAAQALNDTSVTAIAFNELLDTNAFHASGAAVMTIPAGMGGNYRLSASIDLGTDVAGTYRRFYIYKNGNSFIGALSYAPGMMAMIDAAFALAAGDAIDIRGRQDSGGQLNFYVLSLVLQKFM